MGAWPRASVRRDLRQHGGLPAATHGQDRRSALPCARAFQPAHPLSARAAAHVNRRNAPRTPMRPHSFAEKKTKKPDTFGSVRLGSWSRRQESNLDLSLRRAEFYPLKYGESGVPHGGANPRL